MTSVLLKLWKERQHLWYRKSQCIGQAPRTLRSKELRLSKSRSKSAFISCKLWKIHLMKVSKTRQSKRRCPTQIHGASQKTRVRRSDLTLLKDSTLWPTLLLSSRNSKTDSGSTTFLSGIKRVLEYLQQRKWIKRNKINWYSLTSRRSKSKTKMLTTKIPCLMSKRKFSKKAEVVGLLSPIYSSISNKSNKTNWRKNWWKWQDKTSKFNKLITCTSSYLPCKTLHSLTLTPRFCQTITKSKGLLRITN